MKQFNFDTIMDQKIVASSSKNNELSNEKDKKTERLRKLRELHMKRVSFVLFFKNIFVL